MRRETSQKANSDEFDLDNENSWAGVAVSPEETKIYLAESEVMNMTEQAKQQIVEAKTVEEKIKAVNKLLQDGEPRNVSVDTYSGFSGYKPQYIVDAMNAVFHIGSWGFEEVSTEMVSHQTEKGTSALAICQMKVWLKNVEFMPASYGQSRVTKGDLGDAKKGAQTDAIKKALSYFSIGNRAYHGLLRAA